MVGEQRLDILTKQKDCGFCLSKHLKSHKLPKKGLTMINFPSSNSTEAEIAEVVKFIESSDFELKEHQVDLNPKSFKVKITAKLHGFTVMVRGEKIKNKLLTETMAWAPDKLQLKFSGFPSILNMTMALNNCMYCNYHGNDLKPVGFAGRICPNCDPILRPKIEYKGWRD